MAFKSIEKKRAYSRAYYAKHKDEPQWMAQRRRWNNAYELLCIIGKVLSDFGIKIKSRLLPKSFLTILKASSIFFAGIIFASLIISGASESTIITL